MKTKFWKTGLKIVFFIGIIIAALWLSYTAIENELIQELVLKYGYGGVFLTSLFSGFNIIAPIPIISFLPLFIVSGLNLWIIIFTIAVGLTLADSFSYFIGKIGQQLISPPMQKTVRRLEKIRERYNWLPIAILFLFASFVPFPNEIIVIPMVFLGYRITHLLPSLFLGNVIFNSLSAFGIINLFNLI